MKKIYILFMIFLIFIIEGYSSSKWTEQKLFCFIVESKKMEKIKEIRNACLKEQQEEIPEIVDIIVDELKVTALCIDGSVWSWEKNQSEDSAGKILNLCNIKKIMYAGPAMYALSEDGYVFTWGSNEWLQIRRDEAPDKKFEEAEQIFGLNHIVDMDVSVDYDSNRAKIFAIDKSGNFFVYGLYLYWDEVKKSRDKEISGGTF